jgi:electron transfer flavoprotein alpha subunit
MEFNSSRIDDFKDIWVFCEQRDGQMLNTNFELISEGRKLADERGSKLVGVILGEDVSDLAHELGGYGADKVIVCNHTNLKEYTTDAYAKVFCDLVMDKKPEVILIGASSIGRDLAPRCAARLHTGLTADCTHLDIDMNNYVDFIKSSSTLDLSNTKFNMQDVNLKMTRPAFGGHLMATIVCPRFRPCMSTVRPGVMKKGEYSEEKAKLCEVEKYNVKLNEDELNTKVIQIVKETKQMVDLIGAEVIVSVGRGISKDVEKGIDLAKQLANAFGGGVVGGSRAVVDSGWLSSDHQVGQTGKTVHPKVYVALGISGAIQHKAGMQDSELIIAINKDENAPIFDSADYGITGDLFNIVPMMIDEINKVKSNK